MTEVAQAAALLCAGLFAGAAVYINVAEHPARLECGTVLAATVFGPSYRRAAAMQASLASLGTLAGLRAGPLSHQLLWYCGAALLFFVVPFTFLAIMPTNEALLSPDLDRDSAGARGLLERWGRLHLVRSVAGVLSFVSFTVAA